MNVYADTSALVKLLIEEDGSDLIRRLWERAESVLTSLLAYTETRAALAAANRANRISGRDLRLAKFKLESRWQEMRLVSVGARTCVFAGELAERYELRGYDAIHLGSALLVADEDTVMATWDEGLADAARRAGLAVAPPVG